MKAQFRVRITELQSDEIRTAHLIHAIFGTGENPNNPLTSEFVVTQKPGETIATLHARAYREAQEKYNPMTQTYEVNRV